MKRIERPVEDLGLSAAKTARLRESGIVTIADVLNCCETVGGFRWVGLLKLRRVGRATVRDVRRAVAEMFR